jgi:prepilin-type processing-associated H-X9-DG protein
LGDRFVIFDDSGRRSVPGLAGLGWTALISTRKDGTMSRLARQHRVLSWAIHPGTMLALAATLLASAGAQAQENAGQLQPLARYLPAEGLGALVEHNGLDARPDAWRATALYRMLNETSLGAMLEDIAAQVADRALQAGQGAPVTGKELVDLFKHLANRGFAAGLLVNPQPPQPRAVVIVIRGAARSAVFQRVLKRIPPLNEPAARRMDQPGGRTVWVTEEPPRTFIRWWYDKGDFVCSIAPTRGVDPIADVLDGKTTSARVHPLRAALAKTEAGQAPLGLFLLDLALMSERQAMPPWRPDAVKLGLDGIRRVEARWGIQDKAVVTTLAVQAPRPRRGILALFDQPPIGAGASVKPVLGASDYALLSLDLIKFGDAVRALLEQKGPDSVAPIERFAQKFRDRTGLSLRDDVLARLGPRMALVGPAGGGGGGGGPGVLGMWIHPPDFGLVAEVKDAGEFAGTLDRLMGAANRELRAAGAMVRPRPGQPSKPGTEFAEFRRLKGAAHGYVLAVPPSVMPMPPAFRPTVLLDLDRGLLAVTGTPATARSALARLELKGREREREPQPAEAANAVFLARSDPSGMLPELLALLPSIVQLVGMSASQGPPGPAPGMARPPFRLQVDPDDIPDVEAMRSYLFPSKVSLAVDQERIGLTASQAFPLPFPVPQLNIGMETPVLIALLLPAVQSAREAARRAQCVNNLKQIALAAHNYVSAMGGFPAAAIVDKGGKPLLSWRVALLPYLDQNPLYQKFHLDEPWDSPHNKELHKYMPAVYGCPSRNLAGEPGMTAYRVFSNPDALFHPTRRTRIAEVTDGTSNTIMVVESAQAVPWTKPDELPFDKANARGQAPLLGAGSRHPGGLNAVFGDGSVRFLKLSINPMVFRALITKSGGEVVGADQF